MARFNLNGFLDNSRFEDFFANFGGGTSIEDIARLAPDHTWFQLYVGGDAAIADSLLDRAEAAGIRTLVLTVDANFPARRLRDRRNGFALPLRPSAGLVADLLLHPAYSESAGYVLLEAVVAGLVGAEASAEVRSTGSWR